MTAAPPFRVLPVYFVQIYFLLNSCHKSGGICCYLCTRKLIYNFLIILLCVFCISCSVGTSIIPTPVK